MRHNVTCNYHKVSVAFRKRFTVDVSCLEKAVIIKPFMLEKLTVLNNYDKSIFNDNVFEDIKIIKTEGETIFSFLRVKTDLS